MTLSPQDLKLECARIAAVFGEGGDIAALTDRIFESVMSAQPSFCPRCGHDMRAELAITIGRARFDPRGDFTYDGQAIHFSPNERLIIETLMRARGSCVPVPTIIDRLDFDNGDPRSMVHVYLAKIKKRLRSAGVDQDLFRHNRGVGICWLVDQRAEAA